MKKLDFVPAWFDRAVKNTCVPRPRWCPVWFDRATENPRLVFAGAILAVVLITYLLLS